MSLNDQSLRAQGTDVYPGVANPTISNVAGDPVAANFADDPTKKEVGAGAGPNFAGDRDAKKAMRGAAGVVEGHPGIIENTHIDPLNEDANKDDRFSEATVNPGQHRTSAISSTLESARDTAAGAAKVAYGTMTGNSTHVEQGKQAIYGKQA